jgi:cytochrome c556
MKILTLCFLLLIGLSFALPGMAAKDPKMNAIKARQGEMQLRAFNAGPLFAMVKGKIEYNAELASKLAGNLKLMLDLDNGRAWAKGSGNDAYPGKTTALPKIWQLWPVLALMRLNQKWERLVDPARDATTSFARKSKPGTSCRGFNSTKPRTSYHTCGKES